MSVFTQAIYAAHVSATAQPLLPRNRVLLQALSQSAASAEDQGLYGGLRETQLGGDLAVRQSLPLAQQDRAPLVLRHFLEDVLQADELVRDLLAAGHHVLQHLEVVRCLDAPAPPGRTPARQAHVVRNLEQPGRLELRDDAALQTAERVHERRLDR